MTPPDDLLAAALAVRENAHAPYSDYKVGAAIRDDKGAIHAGCNVENAAYPEGQCAETSAIGGLISSGQLAIREILVIGGKQTPGPCSPCGGCRQRIREFADSTTRIWLIGKDDEWQSVTIDDLLPGGFSL
ncbi:MAG: cytidine deaminase [Woeseiaceae bacterium]